MIALHPLGPGDRALVEHLAVAPEQERFSGRAADAFDAAEPGVDLHAIAEGGRVVGFFKIDRRYPETHPFAQPGDVGLRGFLIDRREQGRGLAGAAVRALGPYLAARHPEAPAVVLTVNAANPAAIACYRKGGFTKTGELWHGGRAGPQHVMRRPLRAPA